MSLNHSEVRMMHNQHIMRSHFFLFDGGGSSSNNSSSTITTSTLLSWQGEIGEIDTSKSV
jgi:hypothetical protein